MDDLYLDTRKSMGKRQDGSEKSTGFLGVMKRPDGGISTEISIGTSIDGKETEIPLMVPTLDTKEIKYLLNTPVESKSFMKNMPESIIRKAIEHASMRTKIGKSPFKQREEEWE
jgi:hypothetical protein